jgi:hypothetical protein
MSAKGSTGASVLIKTSTWPRDSHGLFDYESKHVFSRTFKFKAGGNATIVRIGNECEVVTDLRDSFDATMEPLV